MSIDYDSILAVGKRFWSEGAVQEYIKEHFQFKTDRQIDSLEESVDDFFDSLDYLDYPFIPECTILNSFSGDGYILGYIVHHSNLPELETIIPKYKQTWYDLFKDHADIILEVQVW